MQKINEVWKMIPGYEGYYEASNLGRLRNSRNNKILKTKGHVHPYAQVRLSRDNTKKNFLVHVLIALTFLGECPEGYEVNHINLNKRDNRADNLEYLTRKQNVHHALFNGAFKKTVPLDIVSMMRSDSNNGFTHKEIANKYNITQAQVSRILKKNSVLYGENRESPRKVKLTERDIRGILLLKEHMSLKDIAAVYQVSYSAILQISRGRYITKATKGKK